MFLQDVAYRTGAGKPSSFKRGSSQLSILSEFYGILCISPVSSIRYPMAGFIVATVGALENVCSHKIRILSMFSNDEKVRRRTT